MSGSFDESSLGFSQDAPSGTLTNFYLLMGDNAAGYSNSSGDYDSYKIIVDYGNSYSAVVTNNTSYGNLPSANTGILLVNRAGIAVLQSTDYGDFSGLLFTATDTIYYLVSYSASPAYYSMRIGNDTIKESNGIGETIFAGNTYSASLDFTSDSDHFFFTGLAGHTYGINLVSNVADIFLKLVNSNSGEVLGFTSSSGGLYTFTPNSSGSYELVISSNSYVSRGAYSIKASEIVTAQKAPVITTEKHDLSIIVDKGILAVNAVLLKGLNESITFTDGVVTNHLVEYSGVVFDYAKIDSLITTVTRDSEFTAEFTNEINNFLNSNANISYTAAVGLVGLANIDGIILTVAGADGNYVG